ncbi:hypothetical protein KY285_028731 [Solanum tuberosum]|nr:hypothetical protein KY285_028731 [Solanum tuberosum]
MNLVTIGMFSRAAAVRSPILSYGTHKAKTCVPGARPIQPTSNGGESIACRNKSLIRGVSKTLPSVPKNKSPLAPRDGSGGRPYAQATAAPALRSQNRIFLLAFPIPFVNNNSRA